MTGEPSPLIPQIRRPDNLGKTHGVDRPKNTTLCGAFLTPDWLPVDGEIDCGQCLRVIYARTRDERLEALRVAVLAAGREDLLSRLEESSDRLTESLSLAKRAIAGLRSLERQLVKDRAALKRLREDVARTDARGEVE